VTRVSVISDSRFKSTIECSGLSLTEIICRELIGIQNVAPAAALIALSWNGSQLLLLDNTPEFISIPLALASSLRGEFNHSVVSISYT